MDSFAKLAESTVIFVPLSNWYYWLFFFLLNVLKDTMEGLESMDKAAWTKKM
jgi:hypothetical protein